jgi:hypothetical protein
VDKDPLANQMNNTQAKWITAASALFISGLIFLFLPSEIYLRNPLEFISTPAQLIRNLSFGALLLGTGLILPVLLPFGRWQRTYAILIGSLSLALWISSVFLVADLGELDGASFDLTRHGRILTYHTGWFALAFVAHDGGARRHWFRPDSDNGVQFLPGQPEQGCKSGTCQPHGHREVLIRAKPVDSGDGYFPV